MASLSLTLPPLLSHRGDSTGSPRGLKMQPGLKWEPPPRSWARVQRDEHGPAGTSG